MKVKLMKTKLLYTAIIAGTLSFSSCELDEYNPTHGLDLRLTATRLWLNSSTAYMTLCL